MDPDATLRELRELAARSAFDADDAIRFAQLVEALDGWLSRGGFLPKAWAVPRAVPKV